MRSFSVQLQDEQQLLPVQDPMSEGQGQRSTDFLLLSHTTPLKVTAAQLQPLRPPLGRPKRSN